MEEGRVKSWNIGCVGEILASNFNIICSAIVHRHVFGSLKRVI